METAQTTLRDVVGARALQNVVSDREGVAHAVEEIVEGVAEKWGVTVSSILIKDILFSKELQESLSSAATQRRIGESKVIAARAEVDAAKLMRQVSSCGKKTWKKRGEGSVSLTLHFLLSLPLQAADILASPAAMQIRQLEALQNMARGSGTKTIFVPMSLTQGGAFAAEGSSSTQSMDMDKISSLNQLSNM